MLLTDISRNEVEGIEVGKVVATVHLDGLHKSHSHPQPEDRQVVAQEEDPDNKTHAKNCMHGAGG